MYKNFNLTEKERKEIMEMHKSHGYKKPLNEDISSLDSTPEGDASPHEDDSATTPKRNIVKDAISSGKFGGVWDNYRRAWIWPTTYKDGKIDVNQYFGVDWDDKTQKVELVAYWSVYKVFEDFLKLKHKKHTDEGGGEAIYSWLDLPNTMETVNFIGEFLKYAKSQHVNIK